MKSIPATLAAPLNPNRSHDNQLGRALRISTYLHVALLLFLMIKNWVLPSEPKFLAPSLQVDLVSLPQNLKKDVPSPTIPVAEQSESPAASPHAVPAPIERVEAPSIHPNEMVLHPKRAKPSSTKHQANKDREKRIHGALARIKALNKIGGNEKPGLRVAQPLTGNQLSRGTSQSGDAREAAISGYDQALRDRLIQNWALPVWLSRQNLSARVQLFLDGRGNIRNFKFLKRSGSEQFDLAVRKTLEDSQPFPPPPEEVRSWIQSEGVTLGFPL